MFELHPQLAKDCEILGDFPLCMALLNRDGLYPWVILVPKRANITEVFQLSERDQLQLMRESNWVSQTMMTLFAADKMNVAALGNMVPQLHIHHIARFKTDQAWPNPVWGFAPAEIYNEIALEEMLGKIRRAFCDLSLEFTL